MNNKKNVNVGTPGHCDHGKGDSSSVSRSDDLLCCPCGKIPKNLHVVDCGQGGKWAMAFGGCCDTWGIEFRTQYNDLDSDECMKLAIEEWNDAARAI